MKNSGSSWLTTVVVFVVGVLLIAWHARLHILNWIVMLVGAMLIVPAIYAFVIALIRKRNATPASGRQANDSTLWVSVASIALGLWMVINPGFFVALVGYIFGGILVLYGIYHIVTVSVWSRPYVLPFWFYIIPVLMIIAGVVLLFTSVRTMNAIVVLITGIAFVASSFNSILELVATHPSRQAAK